MDGRGFVENSWTACFNDALHCVASQLYAWVIEHAGNEFLGKVWIRALDYFKGQTARTRIMFFIREKFLQILQR